MWLHNNIITLAHLHNLCLREIITSRAASSPVTRIHPIYIVSGFGREYRDDRL